MRATKELGATRPRTFFDPDVASRPPIPASGFPGDSLNCVVISPRLLRAETMLLLSGHPRWREDRIYFATVVFELFG
jgi:hypothetical protein